MSYTFYRRYNVDYKVSGGMKLFISSRFIYILSLFFPFFFFPFFFNVRSKPNKSTSYHRGWIDNHI